VSGEWWVPRSGSFNSRKEPQLDRTRRRPPCSLTWAEGYTEVELCGTVRCLWYAQICCSVRLNGSHLLRRNLEMRMCNNRAGSEPARGWMAGWPEFKWFPSVPQRPISAMEPNQPPAQCIPLADHWPPFIAEMKEKMRYTSISSYVFLARCLIIEA
jgi:hypothetical protein